MTVADQIRDGFSLVLGVGGALGYAHIGVLRALEERGLRPALIVGSSMGALIAAGYALGTSVDDLEKDARTFSRLKFFTTDGAPTIGEPGFLSMRGLMDRLRRQYAHASFEQTKIPLAIVATDWRTGRKVVFTSGDLILAVRASIAIPGYIAPARGAGGACYYDGGLTEPLPAPTAKELCPRMPVLAVDFFTDPGTETRPPGLASVFRRATILFISSLSRCNAEHADFLLHISLPGFTWMDFHRAKDIIPMGYESALKFLDSRLKGKHLNRTISRVEE
ncbi:MAG: patatin-like phospholipase family protein [bacterium JZ-2024 1]